MAKNWQIQINVAQLPRVRTLTRSAAKKALRPSMLWWRTPSLAGLGDRLLGRRPGQDQRPHVTEVEKALRKVIDGLPPMLCGPLHRQEPAPYRTQTRRRQGVVKNWGPSALRDRPSVEWGARGLSRCRIMTERRMLRIFVHRPELRDACAPCWLFVIHPPMQWLCDRLEELEEYCSPTSPHTA